MILLMCLFKLDPNGSKYRHINNDLIAVSLAP